MTKKHAGLLISFDGVDSSGKETQTRALVARLQAHGHTVHEFETPDYTTPSGQDLKRRLQNVDGSWETTPWEEKMQLFAANRLEHRAEVVAALEKGDIVVYDRYVPSSLAFMAIEALYTQKLELPRQYILDVVAKAEYDDNQMPHEDLAIFLDVPPHVSRTLLSKRKKEQRDADEYTDHVEVQDRLYVEYDKLCADTERFARIQCIVNGQLLGIAEVSDLIWSQLIAKFSYLENHA